jgi:hypothetical protein
MTARCTVERLWRGVTDVYHVIEASFLVSAEARKLARLALNRPKSIPACPAGADQRGRS